MGGGRVRPRLASGSSRETARGGGEGRGDGWGEGGGGRGTEEEGASREGQGPWFGARQHHLRLKLTVVGPKPWPGVLFGQEA